MSNRRDTQFFYTPHNKPTLLDCSFTVDATDGSGITDLNKSGRIANVFMHTSTTPSTGNPNPVSGIIVVQLQDNYNRYLGSFASFQSPLTGSEISSGLSVGSVYQITTLGNTSAAQWLVAGVPANVTPAVGVAFVAAATSFTGTGRVKAIASAASGISHIELIGNPVLANSNGAYSLGAGNGMQLIFGCYGFSSTFTGSALGTHTHNFIVKGGQAASTTNNIANYAGPLLGKQEATDATYVGANSATSGGVVAVSAGTPAGTIASASALSAPASGTIISLAMYLNNSAQGV